MSTEFCIIQSFNTFPLSSSFIHFSSIVLRFARLCWPDKVHNGSGQRHWHLVLRNETPQNWHAVTLARHMNGLHIGCLFQCQKSSHSEAHQLNNSWLLWGSRRDESARTSRWRHDPNGIVSWSFSRVFSTFFGGKWDWQQIWWSTRVHVWKKIVLCATWKVEYPSLLLRCVNIQHLPCSSVTICTIELLKRMQLLSHGADERWENTQPWFEMQLKNGLFFVQIFDITSCFPWCLTLHLVPSLTLFNHKNYTWVI